MTLQIHFEGEGGTPPVAIAHEVQLTRRTGSSVVLNAVIDFDISGDSSAFLDSALTPLAAGEIVVIPQFRGEPLFPLLELSLVGIEWRNQNNQLAELSACATRVDRERSDDDPFIPRHRVLHAKNMKALIELFPAVAMLSDEVAVEFEKIEFADAEDATIIQPGVSDYRFVNELLSYAVSHQQGNERMYPVMTGGNSDATAGRWVITWGDKNAYEALGATDSRKCEDDEFLFTSAKTIQAMDARFNSVYDQFPSVTRTLERTAFDDSKWQEWIKQDLPLFSSNTGHMVHEIRDRILYQGASLQWTTHTCLLPDQVSLRSPDSDITLTPWTGIGVVKDAPKEGPWIEVEIPGFEEGANKAKARLVTNYGGPDGMQGFHFVPDVDTQVDIKYVPMVPAAPGGSAHALLLVNGNVRSESAQIASPSIVLPDPLTWDLAAQTVQKVGAISVGSDVKTTVSGEFAMDVSKSARFNVQERYLANVGKNYQVFSSFPVEINAGMQDLHLFGGNTKIVLSKGIVNLA